MDTVQRLEQILEQRQISLFRFTEESGLSYRTLWSAKQRHSQLSIGMLELVCEALDMPVCEFFMEDEDRKAFEEYRNRGEKHA